MKTKATLKVLFTAFAAILFLLLVFLGTLHLYECIYLAVCIFFVVRMLLTGRRRGRRRLFITLYVIIFVLQMIFAREIIFAENSSEAVFLAEKFAGTVSMILPAAVEFLFRLSVYEGKRFPSAEDLTAVSFAYMAEVKNMAQEISENLGKTVNSLTPDNLYEIGRDLPRHSSVRYINKNTLTEEYFLECERSLEDPHLYVVISNTGSAASEIISVFTGKPFNHASLSFDRDLKTIISYNGGENVFPPGLNREQLKFFNKKEDSSVIVYSAAVSREKKKEAIEKIREINSTGSAYNLVGLVAKTSFRPNIMFCSQFVYYMLNLAGVSCFKAKAARVKPTDLVEKDYYRRLEYCYEIVFREMIGSA